MVAQRVEQRHARLDLQLDRLAVDLEADRNGAGTGAVLRLGRDGGEQLPSGDARGRARQAHGREESAAADAFPVSFGRLLPSALVDVFHE